MIRYLADTVSVNCLGGADCQTDLPKIDAGGGALQTALQLVFGTISALCLLIIMIAAIRFASSQGNPQETAKARGAIIYAVVGLVIALSAEAIVTFTLSSI